MKPALTLQIKHLMGFLVPFTVSLKATCSFSIVWTEKAACDFNVLHQHYDIKTVLNPGNARCHSVQNPFSFLWFCYASRGELENQSKLLLLQPITFLYDISSITLPRFQSVLFPSSFPTEILHTF
jgi:hypothetical protein